MTRFSAAELSTVLASNPEISVAEAIVRPEPARAKAMRRKLGGPAPTEEQEQIAVIEWAAANQGRWPELTTLFHIPNGGARNAVTGAMLKRSGVRAGIPDLFLPCARGSYHGLFVELKRSDHSNNATAEQRVWLDTLRREGYASIVAYGADEAVKGITWYLGMEGDAWADIVT